MDGWRVGVAVSDKRELRVENPKLCAEFGDWLRRNDAPLPWNFGALPSELVDANEQVVLTVHVGISREKAAQITAAILTAVNTCGGYKAS